MYVNIGGTWREAKDIYANINGTWRTVTNKYTNVGGVWREELSLVQATGGTVTTDGDYKIHKFTSSGTFSVSHTGVLANLFILGGGGGGGCGVGSLAGGGGGGAGGLHNLTSIPVSVANYPIVVGTGGAGGTWLGFEKDVAGNDGNSSSAFGHIATGGGGGGGTIDYLSYPDGRSGGCGGGAGTHDLYISGNKGTGSYGGNGGAYHRTPIAELGIIYSSGSGGGTGGNASWIDYLTVVGPGTSFLGTVYGIGGGGYEQVHWVDYPTQTDVGPNTPSIANSGNGGNGKRQNIDLGTNGSSGIVIIRYKYK